MKTKQEKTTERLGRCAGEIDLPCWEPASCKLCSRCKTHCHCNEGPVEFDDDELGVDPEDSIA